MSAWEWNKWWKNRTNTKVQCVNRWKSTKRINRRETTSNFILYFCVFDSFIVRFILTHSDALWMCAVSDLVFGLWKGICYITAIYLRLNSFFCSHIHSTPFFSSCDHCRIFRHIYSAVYRFSWLIFFFICWSKHVGAKCWYACAIIRFAEKREEQRRNK